MSWCASLHGSIARRNSKRMHFNANHSQYWGNYSIYTIEWMQKDWRDTKTVRKICIQQKMALNRRKSAVCNMYGIYIPYSIQLIFTASITCSHHSNTTQAFFHTDNLFTFSFVSHAQNTLWTCHPFVTAYTPTFFQQQFLTNILRHRWFFLN